MARSLLLSKIDVNEIGFLDVGWVNVGHCDRLSTTMNIRFPKMQGVSCRSYGLPAFQEGICFMELFVSKFVGAEAVSVLRIFGIFYSFFAWTFSSPTAHVYTHPSLISPKPLD
jgi:hypothetical protein